MQKPHPPLHVAGESNASLRSGQGWLGKLPVDRIPERLDLLDHFLAEQRRTRSYLSVTIIPLEAEVDFGVETLHPASPSPAG